MSTDSKTTARRADGTVLPLVRCRCGCGEAAKWLMTGVDYLGTPFVDDPACDTAANYCSDAAAELRLKFTMQPIDKAPNPSGEVRR